jgi:hypothetical protein
MLKSCFGVISSSEDPNERVERYGAFCNPFEKEKKEIPVFILTLLVKALFGLVIKTDLLNRVIT